VPDLRGRCVAGKDDMGGSAANRITAGNSGITGTTLGAAGGDERQHQHQHTGTTGNNNTTHTHSGTTGIQSTTHTHGLGGGNYFVVSTGQTAGQEGAIQTTTGYTYSTTTGTESANHTHNITTGTESANHTHSFTTANAGAGSSQNVQPTMILNAFIKA
jgi:hypothetical protein